MKKKFRLRRWVKYTLAVIIGFIVAFIFTHLFFDSISNYDDIAKKCDKEKGYICSYYEVRNYGKE